MESVAEGYKSDIEALRKRIIELEAMYHSIEVESKQIIDTWSKERERILEDNQRLEFIARDRLSDIEQKSYENGKLLIKIALAYAELDRICTA